MWTGRKRCQPLRIGPGVHSTLAWARERAVVRNVEVARIVPGARCGRPAARRRLGRHGGRQVELQCYFDGPVMRELAVPKLSPCTARPPPVPLVPPSRHRVLQAPCPGGPASWSGGLNQRRGLWPCRRILSILGGAEWPWVSVWQGPASVSHWAYYIRRSDSRWFARDQCA